MAMTAWEAALWSELDAHAPEDQIVLSGDWIVYVTQYLLTKLGNRRREMVLESLRLHDNDHTKVAELIGSRPNTIKRLAEEARSLAREQQPHVLEVTEPSL